MIFIAFEFNSENKAYQLWFIFQFEFLQNIYNLMICCYYKFNTYDHEVMVFIKISDSDNFHT